MLQPLATCERVGWFAMWSWRPALLAEVDGFVPLKVMDCRRGWMGMCRRRGVRRARHASARLAADGDLAVPMVRSGQSGPHGMGDAGWRESI